MAIVADSSPLIYLAALADFHFLRDLFGSILIPEAVYREVVEQGQGFPVKPRVEAALGEWLMVQRVQNRQRVNEASAHGHLDVVESAAIALALECNAEILLLDDQRSVS